MNKKILLALILAGIMALSMVSCKENEEGKETDAVTDTKAEDTTAFPLFEGTYQTEDNSGWGPIIKP